MLIKRSGRAHTRGKGTEMGTGLFKGEFRLICNVCGFLYKKNSYTITVFKNQLRGKSNQSFGCPKLPSNWRISQSTLVGEGKYSFLKTYHHIYKQ